MTAVWQRAEPDDPWPRLIRGLRWNQKQDYNRAAREFEAGFARLDSFNRTNACSSLST